MFYGFSFSPSRRTAKLGCYVHSCHVHSTFLSFKLSNVTFNTHTKVGSSNVKFRLPLFPEGKLKRSHKSIIKQYVSFCRGTTLLASSSPSTRMMQSFFHTAPPPFLRKKMARALIKIFLLAKKKNERLPLK